MSNLRQHPVFVAENFVFIYFNPNIREDNEFISQWCDRFSYSIQKFNELDSCIDYLTDLDDQAFIILVDTLCETLVPLIHEIPQLIHIYIVHEKTIEQEDRMQTWKKIQIVSNDIALMFNQVHRHIRSMNESSVPITVAKSSSPTNLNELNPSFMYSQLLKEVILQLQYNENAKEQFAEFCRKNSATLMVSIAKINEFEQHYTSQSALLWYTREQFIYSTLNYALRVQDIDLIMKMDFYIQDLHRELERWRSSTEQNTTITLYRGQGMFSAEFQRVKDGEGSFLSFNSFLSTSKDRRVSYIFADAARQNPYLIGVLFVMEIDPSISSVPFASLDDFNPFSEQEILFSMNTIFRIGKVEIIDDRLWNIKLTLTNDTDPQLTELTEHIRKVNEGLGAICQLGSLMIEMGKYDQAEVYYRGVLDNFASDNNYELLAYMYNQTGNLFYNKNDLPMATVYVSRCLDIASNHLPSDHHIFAAVHNNEGMIFMRYKKYERALQSFQQALDLNLHASHPDELNIAILYKNIGDVWKSKRKYRLALENYDFSLTWCDKGVPQLHSIRAALYGSIAYLHSEMGHKSTALSYYQKALEVQERSLPPSHPLIAINHDNIACVLECLNRFEEAAEHTQQAFNINRCAFDPNHPNVGD